MQHPQVIHHLSGVSLSSNIDYMLIYLILTFLIIAALSLGRLLYPRANLILQFSSGFIASTALYVNLANIILLIGLKLNNISLILALLPLLFLILKYPPLFTKIKFTTLDIYTYLILFFLAGISIYISSFWPVRDWDALTLYDFRARLFSDTGSYLSLIGSELKYYLAYPFFTSIVHSIFYIGEVNRPTIYYSIVYFSFCIFIYEYLKTKTSKIASTLGVVLIATSHELFHHSFIAYTNLPYTIYFILALATSIDGYLQKNNRLLLASSIYASTMVQIRYDDPFWIVLLLLSLYFFIKQKNIRNIIYISLPILISRYIWIGYKTNLLNNYPTVSSVSPNQPQFSFTIINLIFRFFEVLAYLYKNLWLTYGYLIMAWMLSILFLLNKKRTPIAITFTIVTTLCLTILVGGTYYTSFVYQKWHLVGGSVTRMMMFLTPLLIINIILNLLPTKDSSKYD